MSTNDYTKKYLTETALSMDLYEAEKEKGFTPPEEGTLPAHGQNILAAAYAACRRESEDKTKCSQIAWAAVKNAGYHKNAEGRWVRAETDGK